jgi:hypothetical protein
MTCLQAPQGYGNESLSATKTKAFKSSFLYLEKIIFIY